MKKIHTFLSRLVLSIILVCAMPAFSVAESFGNQFIAVKLAHGASVAIPRSWTVLQGNEKRTLETATAAAIDLSGYAKMTDGGELLLISNFPDRDLYSALVVTSTSAPGLRPDFIASQSEAELRSAEGYIRKSTKAIQARIGWDVSGWTPLRKIELSGRTAMHYSYVRSSSESEAETRVHIYQIFRNGRTYELSLSTRLAVEGVNGLVLEKIAKSFAAP